MIKCNCCGCHENDVKIMVVVETEEPKVTFCNTCIEIMHSSVLSEYRAIVEGVKLPPNKAIIVTID